jgi:hypothetical protein
MKTSPQTNIAAKRTVSKEALRATVRAIQERNTDLHSDEVQALIDEACAAVRAELRGLGTY